MASASFKFTGKRALVTGAGRGIGRATAKALCAAGAITYALSKTQENLDSLKAECPDIRTCCVDLSDWNGAKKAVQEIGPIDLLVNNAAVLVLQSFLDSEPEVIDQIYDVNVKAVVAVSQVVVKGMIERKSPGVIVNVSSACSGRAFHDYLAYSSSKAALDQVTRVMALELGPHQIRVNSVNPTAVLTDMGKITWSDPARVGPLIARIPVGRLAEEEEVVNAILFLLSDNASMISGSLLRVDGAMLAN